MFSLTFVVACLLLHVSSSSPRILDSIDYVLFVSDRHMECSQYPLKLLRNYLPGSEIHFITTPDLAAEQEQVNDDPMMSYYSIETSPETEELEQTYVHSGVNDREYELFCFMRWLHMANHIRTSGLHGNVLVIDSDVAVLTSALRLIETTNPTCLECTFLSIELGAVSIIHTEQIVAFSNYLLWVYRQSPKHLTAYIKQWGILRQIDTKRNDKDDDQINSDQIIHFSDMWAIKAYCLTKGT